MEQSNKRIAKNTFYLTIRLLFVLAISLYTVRVILEALGVDDYGLYNVIAGLVSMFGFLNTSMANAIQRFFNYEIGKRGNIASVDVYNAAFRTQAILALIVFILSESLGLWYLNTYMSVPAGRLFVANWLFQFSIISLVLTVLQVPYSAAIMAYERMNYYAIVGVIDIILKLGIAIYIQTYTGDRLLIYGVLLVIISLINLFAYYIYVKKHFSWLKLRNNNTSKNLQRSILSFSGWNLLGTFAFMIKGQGTNILLNYFFGVIVNAANGIASQISFALQSFSSNLIIAFKPQLVHSYSKCNYQRTTELFFMMSKSSYALLYMLAVPIIINIDFILHLWLGNEVPEQTSIFTILVIVAMLVNCLHTPITQLIHATGQLKTFQIVITLIMCSIIPISWLFFRLGFDATTCFYVTIALSIANVFCSLIVLKKYYNYSLGKYFNQVIIRNILYSIFVPILPITLYIVIQQSFIELVLSCVLSLLSSAATFYLIVLNKVERTAIISAIKKRIK